MWGPSDHGIQLLAKYLWWWRSHSCQRMGLASSLKTFLINSSRCQGSKRDHFGKKLTWLSKQSLAASLSVVNWLQSWSPFPSPLCIHLLCNVTSQPLSLRGGVPIPCVWINFVTRSGQWHYVPVFRPKPQELCAPVLPPLPLPWVHAPVSLLDRYAESWVSPVVTRDDSDTWDSQNRISKSF